MNNLTKPKIASYLALIFLAGGISGAVISGSAAKEEKSKPPTMRGVCDHMRKRLQSELDLTPDQIKRIEPILRETEREMENVRRRTMGQIGQIIEKSHAEIAKELTPAQQVKLAAMESKRRESLQKCFKDRSPAEKW
jgi:Spy/CpxP family protein refolding chaperone